MYAAGKIPGSFFRREGRPGEQAILTCRLTDRPLRPSFPEGFRNEVQVIATILGADLENPHDIASINGASAALMVSGIPFNGPIGAVRIAHHDGEWVAHPTYQEGDESTFEMVVAGRQLHDGDIAIMMVEAGGTEATWRLYEEGAPKVDRGGDRRRPRVVEAVDRRVDRPPARARAAVRRRTARSPTIEYESTSTTTPDVFDAVAEQAAPRRRRRWRSPTRTSATTGSTRSSRAPLATGRHATTSPGPFAGRAGRSSRRSARCRRRSCAPASSRRASASTAAGPPTSGRSRPRSGSSRPRTAPASSSGARPRC